MKPITQTLDNVQFDHTRWMNELAFTQNEINLYEKRIYELIASTADLEEQEQWKELLTSFIELKGGFRSLEIQIETHIIKIFQQTHLNGQLQSLIDTTHGEVRNQIDYFRRSFVDLKESFARLTAYQK